MLIKKSLKYYLERLSSDSATPGGGSASAAVGALGTSLLLMVVRITKKRAKKPERRLIDKTIRLLARILKDMEEIVDLDTRVYQALIKSYQAAKKVAREEESTQKEIEAALTDSFRLQADLALLVLMAKETLPILHKIAKGSIRNDLLVARGFLDGAFHGAVATARINVKFMKSSKKKHFEQGLEQLEKKYQGIKT